MEFVIFKKKIERMLMIRINNVVKLLFNNYKALC